MIENIKSMAEGIKNKMANIKTANIKMASVQIKKIFFILVSFQFLFLTHCFFGGGSGGAAFSTFNRSVSEIQSPDSDVFYIDLDKSAYTANRIEPLYDINTTETFGGSELRDSISNCEIEHEGGKGDDKDIANQAGTETKICILDIMEYDLYTDKLPIVYNIPEGMCSYVRVTPPWHYNRQVGPGPGTIFECKTTPSSEKTAEETYYCPDTVQLDGCPTSGTTIPSGCSKEKKDLCNLSYGDGEETKHCCTGTYTLDGVKKDWSEEPITHCLGGPGRTSWDAFSKEGFPVSTLHPVKDSGLKDSFVIKSILDVSQRTSHSTAVANFLEYLDRDPDDLRDKSRDKLPLFLQSVGGTGSPDLFFAVECLDSGGEVLHKLQLMIREWNTLEEFAEYYYDGDEKADPDVSGEEGKDCNYESRKTLSDDGDGECNDSLDFDDIPPPGILTLPDNTKIITTGFPGATYSSVGGGGGDSGGGDTPEE